MAESFYQCRVNKDYAWQGCEVSGCRNERRVNPDISPLLRLERYKSILDSGGELSGADQEDLDSIAKMIVEALEQFYSAIKEALAPVVERLLTVINELSNSVQVPHLQIGSTHAAQVNPDVFYIGPVPYPSIRPMKEGL